MRRRRRCRARCRPGRRGGSGNRSSASRVASSVSSSFFTRISSREACRSASASRSPSVRSCSSVTSDIVTRQPRARWKPSLIGVQFSTTSRGRAPPAPRRISRPSSGWLVSSTRCHGRPIAAGSASTSQAEVVDAGAGADRRAVRPEAAERAVRQHHAAADVQHQQRLGERVERGAHALRHRGARVEVAHRPPQVELERDEAEPDHQQHAAHHRLAQPIAPRSAGRPARRPAAVRPSGGRRPAAWCGCCPSSSARPRRGASAAHGRRR